MRGEDLNCEKFSKYTLETPPRAWGRHSPIFKIWEILGNTPTCVGKTVLHFRGFFIIQKHPHVRGEDSEAGAGGKDDQETPPRAWGRPQTRQDCPISQGNTPTCVGKTVTDTTREATGRKHPHVRGEDCILFWDAAYPKETPPRTWGRPCFSTTRAQRLRNTPTCVGKTRHPRKAGMCRQKHPHVRGEDLHTAFGT